MGKAFLFYREFGERVKRNKDPDGFNVVRLSQTPSLDLLEAFGAKIGPKRRGASLILDQVNDNQLIFKVIVSEANLTKLTHPSDVPASVPLCVRRTLNYFFNLGEVQEEPDVANLKPDIDELYEVSTAVLKSM